MNKPRPYPNNKWLMLWDAIWFGLKTVLCYVFILPPFLVIAFILDRPDRG